MEKNGKRPGKNMLKILIHHGLTIFQHLILIEWKTLKFLQYGKPINSFPKYLTFCREDFLPEDHDITPYKFGYRGEEEDGDFFLCRVLLRNETANTYTVEVFEREKWMEEDYDMEETIKDTPALILFDIPWDGIFFRDMPYGRDHHQFWSFRHDMRIPDEIFPDIWKNINSTDETSAKNNEEEL